MFIKDNMLEYKNLKNYISFINFRTLIQFAPFSTSSESYSDWKEPTFVQNIFSKSLYSTPKCALKFIEYSLFIIW